MALYDTLGPDAVEYIVNHADVQIVVSSGKKQEEEGGLGSDSITFDFVEGFLPT